MLITITTFPEVDLACFREGFFHDISSMMWTMVRAREGVIQNFVDEFLI